MRLLAPALLVALLSSAAIGVACDPPPPEDGAGEGEGEGEGEPQDSTEPLPPDTFPCERLDAWPYSTTSALHPLRVHYRTRAEADVAAEMVGYLDEAWAAEVDGLGLPAPLTDELDGSTFGCGEDEFIDVFVFAGPDDAYVDVVAEETDTPIEDYAPYMVVDPTQSFSGAELRPTIFHEFHHTQQAALDWYDAQVIYEASATFVEANLADPDHAWEFTLFDVADHPDWSVDRDAGYDSTFNYGQAAYLLFLQQHYFDGSMEFFRDMWLGLPSPYGEDPDFEDVLDTLLQPHGVTYLQTVPVYARWWAYTGDDDDGAHFARAAFWPQPARTVVDVGTTTSTTVHPMVLGSAYLALDARLPGNVTVDVTSAVPSDVRLVVQRVPGEASDGDVLTLPARVPSDAKLIVTVVPAELPGSAYDPDDRTDRVVDVTLSFTR